MKNAWAGGGDFDPYYQQQVQQVADTFMAEMPEPDFWESLTYEIGDAVGYEWLLLMAAVGAIYIFRKRIKNAIRELMKDG